MLTDTPPQFCSNCRAHENRYAKPRFSPNSRAGVDTHPLRTKKPMPHAIQSKRCGSFLTAPYDIAKLPHITALAVLCLSTLTGCIYPTWTADPDSFADHEVDQTLQRSLKGGGCDPSSSALKHLMELKFPGGTKAVEAAHYLESLGANCNREITDKSLERRLSQESHGHGEEESFEYYICIYRKRLIGGWNENPFGRPIIIKTKHNAMIDYSFYTYTDKDGLIIPMFGHFVSCNPLPITDSH